MIIHLIRPARGTNARPAGAGRGATIPEDFYRAGCPSSVLSCTAWGFSCLANYFASGELLPRLFTLACAFFKEPAVSFLRHFPSTPAYANAAHAFYVACCRVVFGLSSGEPCGSPAIICHRRLK